MRAIGTSVVLLAAGLILPAESYGLDLCARSPFSACATISNISFSGSQLTMDIFFQDASSSTDLFESSFLGSLLLKFTNSTPSVTGITVMVGSSNRSWRVRRNVGNIMGSAWDVAFDKSGGSSNGIFTGQTANITIFFADDVPSGTDLEYAALKMQAIGSANPTCPEGDGECSSWAVVPEPVTMVLLATGLAGVGGAAALRRRRRDSDIETESTPA